MTKIRSRDDSRVQDRRGQGGGGLGIPGLGGGGGLPIPTGAGGGGIIGILVLLAAIFLPKILGAASTPAGGGNNTAPGSGNACETEAEQILCGAEESAQSYWTKALPQFFNTDYQVTNMVFFSGATNTGCGQASSQTGPFYCPADKYVYFDLDFLAQLQSQFNAQGDLAAQYIVAHEFGHHVQNLLGDSQRVQNAGNTNEMSVALELQADCYAGAWANSVQNKFDNPQEVDEALNAAAAVGDDRIQEQTQGRVDPDSFTHGTSAQRVEWFRRGFSTGDPRQCDTFSEMGLN